MKTLKERTEEAIAEGFTVGQLAKAAGKTSTAASLWLSGGTKSVKADSAKGLQKLTGWNWEWWAFGTGPRGETRRSPDEPEASPMAFAITEISRVLAQSLPADVRRDAAYLLQQLAEQAAVERHRTQLIDLLEPFAAPVIVPPLGIDASQPDAKEVTDDASTTPSSRGATTEGRDEWDKRFGKKRSLAPKPGGSSSTTTGRGKSKPDKEKGK